MSYFMRIIAALCVCTNGKYSCCWAKDVEHQLSTGLKKQMFLLLQKLQLGKQICFS